MHRDQPVELLLEAVEVGLGVHRDSQRLSLASAILAESSLSFLGLGVPPSIPSWGSMINAGRGYLQQAPWTVFGPGAALFLTVLGLNFVGDAVRDALDPRLRV